MMPSIITRNWASECQQQQHTITILPRTTPWRTQPPPPADRRRETPDTTTLYHGQSIREVMGFLHFLVLSWSKKFFLYISNEVVCVVWQEKNGFQEVIKETPIKSRGAL
ncbi:hypothetical protein L2E82_12146 [Cichorium intybus]|uniref:Uncharacterized protein n=1 Tax=Cichorium intybus TaxID=13427 RepID=A0ACB9GG01_CICIN|nr:hypothetical protein L2E82_12146 [Cichorium intybus]